MQKCSKTISHLRSQFITFVPRSVCDWLSQMRASFIYACICSQVQANICNMHYVINDARICEHAYIAPGIPKLFVNALRH